MALGRMRLSLTVLAAALILDSAGAATAGAQQPLPRPKGTITRWFNLLTYAEGSNLTHKAEVVAYAVDKCTQYYARASVGVDLGYGSALYGAVNQSTVMTVIDFANYSKISAFDKCIDDNNPPGERIKTDLIKAADFSLNLSAAAYAPHRGRCGYFPGCTGGITQVLAYDQEGPSPPSPPIAEAVCALKEATLGLPSWDISGPDASPLPPFLAFEYITYQKFPDVYQLRAYWAKLQGAPGPPLPSYAALGPLYNARAAIQWTPMVSFVGSEGTGTQSELPAKTGASQSVTWPQAGESQPVM